MAYRALPPFMTRVGKGQPPSGVDVDMLNIIGPMLGFGFKARFSQVRTFTGIVEMVSTL